MTVLPMVCQSGGTVDVYLEPFLPPPRLVLFGLSPVVRALAQLGKGLGYSVDVVDPEAEAHPVPGADRTFVDWSSPELRDAGSPARTFAVVATMGEHDDEAVTTALGLRPAYLGVVASRTRFGQLREGLVARGVAAEPLDRIRNPAGLDIGARLPEEVALSILAEIVQLSRVEVTPSRRRSCCGGARGTGSGLRDDRGGGQRPPSGGARRTDLLLLQPAVPGEVPGRAGAVSRRGPRRTLRTPTWPWRSPRPSSSRPHRRRCGASSWTSRGWRGACPAPRSARGSTSETSTGTMTIKVGPVSSTYRGKVVFERLDTVARTAELVATGQDVRGKGGAEMRLTSSVKPLPGGQTEVTAVSLVNVTGILAQMGRGMIQDVSDEMFQIFSERMRAELERPAPRPRARRLPPERAPRRRTGVASVACGRPRVRAPVESARPPEALDAAALGARVARRSAARWCASPLLGIAHPARRGRASICCCTDRRRPRRTP